MRTLSLVLSVFLSALLSITALASDLQLNPKVTKIPSLDLRTIKLGGVVEIPEDALQPVFPIDIKGRCESTPFTEEEVARVANSAIESKTEILSDGTRKIIRSINLPARNDKPARQVLLADYVAELNKTEAFFNYYGVTLRHGPYSTRPGVKPGVHVRGLPCKSRDSMQKPFNVLPLLRFKLTDPPPTPKIVIETDVPKTKPNAPGPGDVMERVSHNIYVARMKPETLTLEGKNLLLGSYLFKDLPSNGLTRKSRLTNSCQGCDFVFGENIALKPEGELLVNNPDEVIYSNYICVDPDKKYQNFNDPSCPQWARSYISKKTRRMVWASAFDVDKFLVNYKTPCLVKNDLGAYFDTFYKYDLSSDGDTLAPQGSASSNFFEGKLTYDRKNVRNCLFDLGSNGFFDATACLTFESKNRYAPDPGFDIQNQAGMQASATLFGLSFNLIDGTNTSHWVQPYSSTGSVVMQSPQNSSSLEAQSKSFNVDGPKAIFPLGPIPLTISSAATANFVVGAPNYIFNPIPLKQGVDGTGRVGAGVQVNSSVMVSMSAALDALILSAGIEGQLNLLGAKISGDILSRVNPKANELWVDKSYSAQGKALASKIFAFVEVDLVVYTERYDIEIASFDGLDANTPLTTKSWGPFGALIPTTIKAPAACSN